MGQEVFTIRIDGSPGLDWRRHYDCLSYTLIDTPPALAKSIRTYLDAFGLVFAVGAASVGCPDQVHHRPPRTASLSAGGMRAMTAWIRKRLNAGAARAGWRLPNAAGKWSWPTPMASARSNAAPVERSCRSWRAGRSRGQSRSRRSWMVWSAAGPSPRGGSMGAAGCGRRGTVGSAEVPGSPVRGVGVQPVGREGLGDGASEVAAAVVCSLERAAGGPGRGESSNISPVAARTTVAARRTHGARGRACSGLVVTGLSLRPHTRTWRPRGPGGPPFRDGQR